MSRFFEKLAERVFNSDNPYRRTSWVEHQFKTEATTKGQVAIIKAQAEADVERIEAQAAADQATIRTTRSWTGKVKTEVIHHSKTQADKCLNSYDPGSGNHTNEAYLDGYGYSDVR